MVKPWFFCLNITQWGGYESGTLGTIQLKRSCHAQICCWLNISKRVEARGDRQRLEGMVNGQELLVLKTDHLEVIRKWNAT